MYILPPSISKKIEGYRWQSFTPPAAGKSRRFRGLICHRRSHCPYAITCQWLGRTRPERSLSRSSVEKLSRSAKDQVAAWNCTARTCWVSDWRSRRSDAMNQDVHATTVWLRNHHCSHRLAIDVLEALRRSAHERQIASAFWNGLSRRAAVNEHAKSAPQRKPCAGSRRTPHHRAKSRWNSGSECGNGSIDPERDRLPRRAPLYPVCVDSSPRGCGTVTRVGKRCSTASR